MIMITRTNGYNQQAKRFLTVSKKKYFATVGRLVAFCGRVWGPCLLTKSDHVV